MRSRCRRHKRQPTKKRFGGTDQEITVDDIKSGNIKSGTKFTRYIVNCKYQEYQEIYKSTCSEICTVISLTPISAGETYNNEYSGDFGPYKLTYTIDNIKEPRKCYLALNQSTKSVRGFVQNHDQFSIILLSQGVQESTIRKDMQPLDSSDQIKLSSSPGNQMSPLIENDEDEPEELNNNPIVNQQEYNAFSSSFVPTGNERKDAERILDSITMPQEIVNPIYKISKVELIDQNIMLHHINGASADDSEVSALFWVVILGYQSDLYKLLKTDEDKFYKYIMMHRLNIFDENDYISVLDCASYCKRAPMVEVLVDFIQKKSNDGDRDRVSSYLEQSTKYLVSGDMNYYGISDLALKLWRRTPFGKSNYNASFKTVSVAVTSGVILTTNTIIIICYFMGVGFVFAGMVWSCVGAASVGGFLVNTLWNVCKFGGNKLITISKTILIKLKNHVWSRQFAKPRCYILMKVLRHLIDTDTEDRKKIQSAVDTIFNHASSVTRFSHQYKNKQMMKALYDLHTETKTKTQKPILNDTQASVCKGVFISHSYHNWTRKWTGYGGRRVRGKPRKTLKVASNKKSNYPYSKINT